MIEGYVITDEDVDIAAARAVVACAKAAGRPVTAEEAATVAKLTGYEKLADATPADVYAARAIVRTSARLGELVDDDVVMLAGMDPDRLTRLEDRRED